MVRTIIESPYVGEVAANIAYAKRCMRDSFKRGEAPFASHLLYTLDDLLDDSDPEERKLGMRAGLVWGYAATIRAVYVDRGISTGMQEGILEGARAGQHIEVRALERGVTKEDLRIVWKATNGYQVVLNPPWKP